MWKRDALSVGSFPPENQDSDQSISEEDEEGLDADWIQHTVSLGAPVDNKGGVQVLSQLEKLADAYKHEPNDAITLSSPERKPWFDIDDEVEDPFFNEGDGSTHRPLITSVDNFSEGMIYLPSVVSPSHSKEETPSDGEKTSLYTHDYVKKTVGDFATWSQASREAEALDFLHKNSHCSSSHGRDVSLREKQSSKGDSRKKGKQKLSFHFQSCQKGLSTGFDDGNDNTPLNIHPLQSEVGTGVPGDTNITATESQLIFQEEDHEQIENIRIPSEPVDRNDFKEHSMAEFLDCFRERSVLQRGSLKTDGDKRERSPETILLGNASYSGDMNVDDSDDLPEAIESGPFEPSDDEENPQNLKSDIPRSMADQFLEVYGTVSAVDDESHFALPVPSGGLFGKLQQVVQREKERDIAYLKSLTSSKDESISVRILSRSLEAKLTVCSCSCLGDEENSYSEMDSQMMMKSTGRNSTVIFNPKICTDVELEVGNLIRIHQPWKEVQVKGRDGVIILCSYFSQINC